MSAINRAWSSAEIRSLLERSIRSDADLNAFCIDYFPDVYRRFASGMDRVEKINLLLAQEGDLGRIAQRLSERFPDAEGQRASELAKRVEGRSPRVRVAILLASAVLMALLAAGLIWSFGRPTPTSSIHTPSRTESTSLPAGTCPVPKAAPADRELSAAPRLPEHAPSEAPRLPMEPCGKGNLNASCNSIQAAPGSQININAQQGR